MEGLLSESLLAVMAYIVDPNSSHVAQNCWYLKLDTQKNMNK